MQESELEEQNARKAMVSFGLSMKHEKVLTPLLAEVESAVGEKRPVSFDDYAKSIAHRAPKGGFSEEQLARNAVSDLKEAIAFHKDFSLWDKEQKGHEKTISSHKPSGRLERLKDRVFGNYKVDHAKERIRTIEGYRKERQASVERMTAACRYIRKMHL